MTREGKFLNMMTLILFFRCALDEKFLRDVMSSGYKALLNTNIPRRYIDRKIITHIRRHELIFKLFCEYAINRDGCPEPPCRRRSGKEMLERLAAELVAEYETDKKIVKKK